MDELAAAKRDADMGRSLAYGLEEDEIASLYLVRVHFFADVVLLARLAWQCGAVPSEDPLDEAAAVESP